MKKALLIASILALAPLAASAEVWKNASLLDSMCAAKEKVAKDPDSHPTSCALQCAKSGYGIMTDGKFLKFDEKGNEQVAAALKSTKKTDHLRVTVDGERKGDTIAVKSVSLD